MLAEADRGIIMRELKHYAALPYCYYDRHKKAVQISVVSYNDEVEKVSIIYGDPFHYEKSDGDTYTWCFKEEELTKKMVSVSSTMWHIELPVLKYKRMKYGFLVTFSDGTRKYFSENGYQDILHDNINFPHNHFVFPFIHEVDSPNVSKWAEDTIWYQIFPERFFNGDTSISPKNLSDWNMDETRYDSFYGGDLAGIIKKLEYLKELGITGLYMTPIFEAPSNHKYDTVDYLSIDKHFGDTKILKELVKKAHGLGIKVMLDAVFNHVGIGHEFWQDILINQEKSRYKDYFHIKSFPVKASYVRGEDINYDTFAFSSRMPKWNTENKEAREYLLKVAAYWIDECDIDGWRLDVADEVSFDFWNEFGKVVRSKKKEFYVVGEVWHNASKWINPGYFDAVMNYPVGVAIEEMFLTKQISGADFSEKLFYLLSRYSELHNMVAFNLMDSHDTKRALTAANMDKQALRNAFTMLLLLPGSPCIYYGTEIGMYGKNDPDCRKPMIWDEDKRDNKLLSFFKDIISLRKRYISVIKQGNLSYENKDGLDIWRLKGEKEEIMIAYNKGNQAMPKAISYKNKNLVFDTSKGYITDVCEDINMKSDNAKARCEESMFLDGTMRVYYSTY